MISPIKHWQITKDALEKYGYDGLGALSFSSLLESIRNAEQSAHLTALRVGLALSMLFNFIMLVVLFFVIGGR